MLMVQGLLTLKKLMNGTKKNKKEKKGWPI
jgi:hypothetical protein